VREQQGDRCLVDQFVGGAAEEPPREGVNGVATDDDHVGVALAGLVDQSRADVAMATNDVLCWR
jgi:hypothetical protein